MSDEIANHTLKLLQEIRAEMRERFDQVDARFEGVDKRFEAMNEQFAELEQHVKGNTLTFNLVAGAVYDHEHHLQDHDKRVAALERIVHRKP